MTDPPVYHDTNCGYGSGAPTPDVAGVIVGLRGWQMDLDGNLRGCTYPVPWTPDVNTARCLVSRQEKSVQALQLVVTDQPVYSVHAGWMHPDDTTSDPITVEGYTPDPCGGLEPDCGCGFYAYYDRAQGRSHGYGSIRGAVEAWGKIVVGPKGFRAQHARVVGIVKPASVPRRISRRPGLHQRLVFLERAHAHVASARLGSKRRDRIGVGVGIAAAAMWGWASMSPWQGLAFLAFVGVDQAIRRWRRRRKVRLALEAIQTSIDQTQRQLDRLDAEDELPVDELMTRFRARYPGIPVYDSMDDLIAAHPPSNVEALLAPPPEDNIVRGDS